MENNWIEVILLVLGVVLVAFFVYRGMKFSEAKVDAQEIATVARWAVLAAEEYGRTGKLSTSQEKLVYAANIFRKRIPLLQGVDDEEMMAAIHSFIPLANSFGLNINITQEPTLEQTALKTLRGE